MTDDKPVCECCSWDPGRCPVHDLTGSAKAAYDFMRAYQPDPSRIIRIDFVERYVLGVVAVTEGATPIGVPDWSDLTDAEQEESERLVAGWLVGSVEIVACDDRERVAVDALEIRRAEQRGAERATAAALEGARAWFASTFEAFSGDEATYRARKGTQARMLAELEARIRGER